MSSTRFLRLPAPPVDFKQIERYALFPEGGDRSLIAQCLEEIREELSYTVCFRELELSVRPGGVDTPLFRVQSRDLATSLSGCTSCLVFAATIGLAPDRMIRKYEKISPLKSLVFQAVGAERIESLCDSFCNNYEKGLSRRFSPGYGDLSIEFQRELFDKLEITKYLGVTLTSSLLMVPTKSVTAIAGITGGKKACEKHDCSLCGKTDCSFRKVGI